MQRSSQGQPFVGRESELRQLLTAFDAAAGGDGRLVLLVGEPGIGKTAVCDQLARFVTASGGQPLVGHCYEEGSFRPPYQPFVEIFATLLERDADTLLAELGSGAADLARMIPMLRERIEVTPRTVGDPEEDRWRLLQAATDLLRNAAAKQPLVVVLEDLHDADRGTLDLLLYLARNLHGARLLVVGTYRDVAVDRVHPLAAALTELHRGSNVSRIQLHGLSTDEVQQLLAETSQQRIPQAFAELVQRQTEGNPLFVHETLRFVIDTGLVERRDGALQRAGSQSLAGRIPEGLRDAVGKHLSRLSRSTNRVLSVASVLGREFQLDVLRRVLDSSEDELEAALEEALTAGIIEERSLVGTTVTYRFGHGFFRQTLYDEILAPRRIRLHQQVARVLEAVHAGRVDEHAEELAEHYAFSSDASDLAKAVRYGALAARRATEVFAYGEAARQLERALAVQDLADPGDGAKRCDLLLGLGEALLPAGQTEHVIAHIAPDALALAEILGDRGHAYRACRLAVDCLWAQGSGSGAAQPEYLTWAERATEYAQPESIERSHADLALASALYSRGQFQQARSLRQVVLARARQQDDRDALFRSTCDLLIGSAPRHWIESARLAEECAAWPRQGVSSQTLGPTLWICGLYQLARGERARAEELWRQVREMAERMHDWSLGLYVARSEAILALIDGHLEDALLRVSEYVERADESGAPLRGRQFGVWMRMAPVRYLGRADVWLDAFDAYARIAGLTPGGPNIARQSWPATYAVMVPAARAMCLAQLGREPEAEILLGPLLNDVNGTCDDELPTGVVVLLLQAAILLEHRVAAQTLAARLAGVAHLNNLGITTETCIGRHVGDAAALVGDRAAARAYYAQALEVAGKIGFRPEVALTHVSLAELLLQEGDEAARSEALEHLDGAIPELRDMKMQPALERALALRENVTPTVAKTLARESTSNVLTARGREIANLMSDGLSNHDIAETLVISEGTVEVHVKHILSKLGFRSRTQVAGWFARQQSA